MEIINNWEQFVGYFCIFEWKEFLWIDQENLLDGEIDLENLNIMQYLEIENCNKSANYVKSELNVLIV